jgi:hypothetical protein
LKKENPNTESYCVLVLPFPGYLIKNIFKIFMTKFWIKQSIHFYSYTYRRGLRKTEKYARQGVCMDTCWLIAYTDTNAKKLAHSVGCALHLLSLREKWDTPLD